MTLRSLCRALWLSSALVLVACSHDDTGSRGHDPTGSPETTTSSDDGESSGPDSTDPGVTCREFAARGPGCCHDGEPECSKKSSDWRSWCEEFTTCEGGLPGCFFATDCDTLRYCALPNGC